MILSVWLSTPGRQLNGHLGRAGLSSWVLRKLGSDR
jgi:hypothetical protein